MQTKRAPKYDIRQADVPAIPGGAKPIPREKIYRFKGICPFPPQN